MTIHAAPNSFGSMYPLSDSNFSKSAFIKPSIAQESIPQNAAAVIILANGI